MRFSIILPAYNVGKYIADAIKSVLNQTFKNYELIVINDCSTDNTHEMIKLFEKDIIYVNNEENTGVAKARNNGLDQAIGEYIIFLDGDDKLKSNDVLEKLDNLIGNEEPDIVYLGLEFEHSKRIIIPTYEEKMNTANAVRGLPNVWSKCWNSEFLNENQIRFVESLKYYEDVPFAMKGILLSNSFKIADFITHVYTDDREGGATDDFNKAENIRTVIDIYAYIAELVKLTDIVPIEARNPLFDLIRRSTTNSTKWLDLREKYLENQDKEMVRQ